jgi:dolichol-phosphate mannosyltransferase
MSGMFMLKAEILTGITLAPMGYKILLEVLAKARYRNMTEVSYMFAPRDCGTSKLGARQMIEYFLHLGRLAFSTGQLTTWVSYATVGLAGASVHLALLLFLAVNHGWALGLALPVAIQVALLNNFAWNRLFTFRRPPRSGRTRGEQLTTGFARYEAVCIPGALLNSLLTILLSRFGCSILIAGSAGVLIGGIWNLFFNVPAIWRTSVSQSLKVPFSTGPKVGAANLS